MEAVITTKEGLRDTINQYGFAIIPSVLSEDKCEAIVSGLWDYFEHITQTWEVPINRQDQSSWKEIYKLYPLHSMLFQYFNCGHAQISWDVRQDPAIIEIFAHFWGVSQDELSVSFDGLGFNVPPEVTKRGWNLNNTWYHTDQSYSENDFKCAQSWITGLDVNEGDATLAVMEGSNNYHKEFRDWLISKNIPIKKDNWYKLSREEEQFYLDKGCSYKKIICPKGSLVFWDSRTIHCGVEATKQRILPNFRAVIYLCYIPKCLFSARDRKKRLKAFEELRTTNHWGNKLFPKNPRTYGSTLPKINIISSPIISDIGKSLIGFI
jgi:hypothetical protein